MTTDVLFVTPPSRKQVYQDLSKSFAAIEPPVWSSLIAKRLIEKNFSVKILDAEAENLDHQQTGDKIIEIAPILTVFMIYGQQPSASTQCMPGGNIVCSYVNKKTKNEFKTLVIGTHASALPERTLIEEPYTFVCQGEGPVTIELLLDYIKFNKGRLEQVPGLFFKNSANEIVKNKRSKMFEDLDSELPGQSWSLLNMKKYRAHNWHVFGRLQNKNRYASLQTSLGCPFKCSFCCINAPFERNMIRCWSPKHVIKEIIHLTENYNIFDIKIPDEMFVLSPKQVIGICDEIISNGLGDKLNFWAYARIDTLQNDKMLKKMYKAGIKWLAIGVESSSDHVRDGVTKGKFSNIDIKNIIKKVRDIGFNVGANYIFGLPDDDLSSMRKTLDLALEINSEWANFYSAMAYPGSQLYQLAKKNKWVLPDDENGPGWIGYSQHSYHTLPLRTDKIKASEVLDFRDSAFNEYFKSANYHSLIRKKFGNETLKEIHSMNEHIIKRKHHLEEVNY